jgi:hypothetical protein
MATRKSGKRTKSGRPCDMGVSASADRAGVPSGLSRVSPSQPQALIAYAESFGEFASMCFAGGRYGKGH